MTNLVEITFSDLGTLLDVISVFMMILFSNKMPLQHLLIIIGSTSCYFFSCSSVFPNLARYFSYEMQFIVLMIPFSLQIMVLTLSVKATVGCRLSCKYGPLNSSYLRLSQVSMMILYNEIPGLTFLSSQYDSGGKLDSIFLVTWFLLSLGLANDFTRIFPRYFCGRKVVSGV